MKEGDTLGRRGRPQWDPPEAAASQARQRAGDLPFLLLPSTSLGQLNIQVTSRSSITPGQLFSSWSLFLFLFFLNLTISLPRLPSVQQLAAVVASVLIG